MAPGMPAKRIAATARKNAPKPIVTMISAIVGCPTSGRRITRLKATASATMPAHPRLPAPRSPSPRYGPDATTREPNITHSPRAKLITREAL